MSIDRLLNVMRLQASINGNDVTHARLGVVTSYDPTNHTVRVKIQPEDPKNPALSLSGNLPVLSPYVGAGWGLVGSSTPGDLVMVIFQEGDPSNGFVLGTIWKPGQLSPAVPSGEFWLVHKSGSYLKFTNDGKVALSAQMEVDITAPSIKLCESLTHTLKSLMTDDIINIFNNHIHSNVQMGGDVSGPPTTSFSSSNATNVIKAE